MKLLNRLMSYLLRKQGYKVIDPITQIDLSTPALMRDPNAVALATKAMTQDLGEAYEAMGMIKAFSFIRKIATVAH